MTTIDEIETILTRAFAVAPSADAVQVLDQRVARAMAGSATIPRRWAPSRRLFLRPLALVAAFVVLTGTVVGAMNLLERTVGSNTAFSTAWDRAEILGIERTNAGLTLTLERAYADVNQTMVFMTVEGLGAPTLGAGGQANISWTGELRDPSGRQLMATSMSGTGAVEPDMSVIVQSWAGAPAPTAGTWELIVTSAGYEGGGMVPGICTEGATEAACDPPADTMIDGTWRFEFDLPEPAGSVIKSDVSDTVGQGTVTLTELRVSPTMIVARLALRVDGAQVVYWSQSPDPGSSLSIRHGDTTYLPNSGYHVTQDPDDHGPDGDVNEWSADVGSVDAAGTWQIEIPAIAYHEAATSDPAMGVRLAGPWTLTVTVP